MNTETMSNVTRKADVHTALEAARRVDRFLNSSARKMEIFYGWDGFGWTFLTLVKRTWKRNPSLEIHTPGFDGVLLLAEAKSWVKWEIVDRTRDGYLVNDCRKEA